MDQFAKVVDSWFNISDNVNPAFQRGGTLRPLVDATAAHLVMYYDEFCKNKEVGMVQRRLRGELHLAGYASSDYDVGSPTCAGQLLRDWGTIIRAKFEADNLFLTARESATATDRLVSVVQAMNNQLSSALGQINALRNEVCELRRANRVDAGERQARYERWEFEAARHAVGVGDVPSSSPGPQSPAATNTTGARATPPTARPPSPPTERPARPPPKPRDRAKSSSVNDVLAPRAQAKDTADSHIKGHTAADFVVACYRERGGKVDSTMNSQNRSRASKCLNYFKSMMSHDEKQVIRDQRNPGAQRALAKRLNDLVMRHLAGKYVAAGKVAPPVLTQQPFEDSTVNAVESHMSKLKRKSVPSDTALRLWRRDLDAPPPAPSPAPAPPVVHHPRRSAAPGRPRQRPARAV